MMKNLLLVLSMLACVSINARPTKKPLCTQGTCSKSNADACSCYCSVKCGPREIEPQDTPKYDEETGQCFCAPRDKVLYIPNECDKREAEKLQQ